jgi:hypothetical protein
MPTGALACMKCFRPWFTSDPIRIRKTAASALRLPMLVSLAGRRTEELRDRQHPQCGTAKTIVKL